MKVREATILSFDHMLSVGNESLSTRYLDLLQGLDYAERSAREQHINNTDAHSSTFEWIWTIDKSHTSLKQWLANSQPVFWIQGKPGSGKSMLIDYLSSTDRVPQLLRSSSEGRQWNVIRFFFDSGGDKGIANNFEGLLRSLLLQILEGDPQQESELHSFRTRSYLPGQKARWDMRDLRKAFHNALAKSSDNLCMFVDGLDEYKGDMQELLTFLVSVTHHDGTLARHKICLASRPEPAIALRLESCHGLRMQDHNIVGIEQYVSNIMTFGAPANEKGRLHQLSYGVADRAEGVFLWARFAVLEILSSVSEGEDDDETYRRLDKVPPDLDGVYAKILGRMNAEDQHEARLMFHLVCFAIDDLTVLQLKEAITVAKGDNKYSWSGPTTEALERFHRRIRAKSAGLAEVIDKKDDSRDGACKVRLIHRTVKSYLERERWLLGWRLDTRIVSPHALWLHICCKHVQCMLGSAPSRSRHVQEIKVSWLRWKRIDLSPPLGFSLLQYILHNLFIHARNLERYCQESSYSYLSLVTASLWRFLLENYRLPKDRHVVRDQWAIDWDTIAQASDIQPWRIVIEQGLALCCRDVIAQGLYKLTANDDDLSLALRSAVHYFHDDGKAVNSLIRTLLDSGVVLSEMKLVVCLREGTASALEILLEYWPEGCIRLRRKGCHSSMFNNEYEPEHTFEEGTNGILWELAMIPYTNQSQFKPMLDLLIARGEDVNATCGWVGTMLHVTVSVPPMGDMFAAIIDLRRISSILLEHGANVKVCTLEISIDPGESVACSSTHRGIILGHPLSSSIYPK